MRATWLRVAAVTAVFALLAPTVPAAADTAGDLGDSSDHVTPSELTARFATTGKWFIEFASEPTVSGGSSSTVRAQQDKFVSDAKRRSIPVTVSKRYQRLFNGMSVSSDAEGAAALADLPGVTAVYPVVPVELPEPQAVNPQLSSAVAMTGADVVRSELGHDGEGVRVGIIDSGVDFDHPDLGGTGVDGGNFPTARVTHGRDLVGDDYNADPLSPGYQPVPKPDSIPDDCQGHGTHVAGIVGASGEVDGVAPGVTFGAYRVFGCGGSTDTEIILSAMEQALTDGMDVVNLSLGSGFQTWPDYPSEQAADRLVEAGVIVVASAGNDGESFTQATGAPGVGKNVISVASHDNTALLLDELLVIDDPQETASVGILPAAGSPDPDASLNGLKLAWTTDPQGCVAETRNLTGLIAVTSRGTCSFHEKALFAQQAGAEALLLANHEAGVLNATVEGSTAITIPVMTVTQAQGQSINKMLTDADRVTPTVKLTGESTSQPNPTGGLVSGFSSWGLAADLTLKPDLSAPGGSIRSTYPLEKGGYLTNSGTSMSAPHAAGAVALMLDADTGLAPDEILSRLQNTATPTMFSYAPQSGVLDAAHHQGAGLIQVDKAILGGTVVKPGKISAGESADGPHTETLSISNTSATPVTYTLSHEDAVSTYVDSGAEVPTQNSVAFTVLKSSVRFSAPTVTVPAGGTAQVEVTIAADPGAVEGSQYSGYLVLRDDEGSDPLTIPFAGMAGDYGNLKVFPDLDLGLPALVTVDKCGYWEEQQCVDPAADFDYAPAGRNFALGRDLPTIALHLAVPVLRLELHALQVDAAGMVIEGSARPALGVDRIGRDSGLSLWSWDGRVQQVDGLTREVAPGNYALRLTAHEADGDGGTQVWTSPAFGVKNARTPYPSATPSASPTAPNPQVDLYSTPGHHRVNGRDWFTACEPYSQTVRCRTSIMATTVIEQGGRFIAQTRWVFNNLTYLPSSKALWVGNPLAAGGQWTASDGRQWRTECGTPSTGRNGCRSYSVAKVIEVAPQGGYRWTRKWVFNNMVRFS